MNKKTHNGGFSTLELLIAFAILTLSIVAVIMVVFGNQEMSVDTELAQRALYQAEENLEIALAEGVSDLDGIVSYDTALAAPFVSEKIEVAPISACAKEVVSTISWQRGERDLQTTLRSTVVDTDIAHLLGSACSAFPPTSDWDTPTELGHVSPSLFNGEGTGVALTFIDNIRYAVVTTNSNNNDFYVVDTSDPMSVSATNQMKLNVAGGDGLSGVAVGKIGGVSYAFVISNNSTNHLYVVDLQDPENPSLIPGATRTLPDVTNAIPRSIFFYDERLYIGIDHVACAPCLPHQNNELHIYDVSIPSSPTWEASIDTDRNVNDISVFDHIAYLATDPGASSPYTPLKIYDVDPASSDYLDEIGDFAITQDRAGSAVHYYDKAVYLGTAGPHFYALDVSTDPAAPVELANSALDGNTDVGDITAQGHFVFLGIRGGNSQNVFQVMNITDKTNPWRVNPQSCMAGSPLPQNLNGVAFDSDLIFAAFRSNSAFRIIYDTENVCTP